MIHLKIKELLGFNSSDSDETILKKWRERVLNRRKPCWDLKYCPYGELVEQFPLLPPSKNYAITHNEYLKKCLASGISNGKELDEKHRMFFKESISEFNPDDYPEENPPEIEDWTCEIFGHICPVVYSAENFAEEH